SAFNLAQISEPPRSMSTERSFPAPAAEIQAALNKLQPTLSGRLPTLDGFIAPTQESAEHYRRPYYQCTVRVIPTSGGSVVRITAKITAWHENPPRSGYEVLQSNGRLETDLLDRLQESLAPKTENVAKSLPAAEISAPMPQLPQHSNAISPSPLPSGDQPLRE